MLESLINPKRAEKGPWKMFFIGILYASLSLLLVHFLFKGDSVLSKFSGLIVVLFCVMFSLPFVYYVIKNEEKQDEEVEGFWGVWRAHSDAIYAFMWLFLGFIVAFSFWYIVLQNSSLLNAQIETYCSINSPGNVENCVSEYSFTNKVISSSATTNGRRFLSILGNNFGVMIFTLLFSLIFGAGAIFILAWNASVISAAIGIFTRYKVSEIPVGILRYMIHKKFLRVLLNVIVLMFIAIIILLIAAVIEVYFTPLLFN